MSKKWRLAEKISPQAETQLQDFSPLVRQLLFNRGLTEARQASEFISPRYENLHDPYLFQDMGKAVARIQQAVDQKEKIFIYGDYDADAVTANAVMQRALQRMGLAASSYIPDRFSEGYGLNLDAFEKIRAQGGGLVITVDCGTNSRDAADYCRAHGMDLIVTDHHEVIGDLPKAYALINPKNPGEKYPYHEITGVGVAFKLASALLAAEAGWEKWLLDLVSIGTVADCHSLAGENRILVHYGLKVLEKTKWPGLRSMYEKGGLEGKKPDSYALGFVLAPRLNAAGRLEHADIALRLLMAENKTDAQPQAEYLENLNAKRRLLTEQVLSEAREKAQTIADRKILVLMGEGWPKGVVGLVAGKIAEEFRRPTVVLSQEKDMATGSARSVGDFNVVASLIAGAEFLEKYGGHKQAAGLSLRPENFENFYRAALKHAEANLRDEDIEQVFTLESQLTGADLNIETVRNVNAFEPFGVDNPRPRFMVAGVKVREMRPVGKEGQHFQFKLEKDGNLFSSILFRAGHFAKNVKLGDTIDIAGEMTEDTWNGNSMFKFRIADLRPAENILP